MEHPTVNEAEADLQNGHSVTTLSTEMLSEFLHSVNFTEREAKVRRTTAVSR
jgi:hypothetical protein